jgi:hypothetical protein
MLSVGRVLIVAVTVILLSGCTHFIDRVFPPLVAPEEIAEIKVAIRKVTRSPVTFCTRPIDSAGLGPIIVWTADKKTYNAQKTRGKWYIHEIILVGSSPHLTMRWSERLAALLPHLP